MRTATLAFVLLSSLAITPSARAQSPPLGPTLKTTDVTTTVANTDFDNGVHVQADSIVGHDRNRCQHLDRWHRSRLGRK